MIIGSLLVAACGGGDAAQSFDSIEEMGAVIEAETEIVCSDWFVSDGPGCFSLTPRPLIATVGFSCISTRTKTTLRRRLTFWKGQTGSSQDPHGQSHASQTEQASTATPSTTLSEANSSNRSVDPRFPAQFLALPAARLERRRECDPDHGDRKQKLKRIPIQQKVPRDQNQQDHHRGDSGDSVLRSQL